MYMKRKVFESILFTLFQMIFTFTFTDPVSISDNVR